MAHHMQIQQLLMSLPAFSTITVNESHSHMKNIYAYFSHDEFLACMLDVLLETYRIIIIHKKNRTNLPLVGDIMTYNKYGILLQQLQ